jgi:hypothetical protein
LSVGIAFVVVLVALGAGRNVLEKTAAAQGGKGIQIPALEVDVMWPKQLPNNWIVGSVIGVAVDSQDHIWMIHRPSTLGANETGSGNNPPTAEYCCKSAPPILEFDQAGNLVSSWGGPGQGYDWPKGEHAIFLDHKDNVWIGSNDRTDGQILKFNKQGKFLLQIGHANIKQSDSNSKTDLGSPANIEVDPTTNEVYVADGYRNRRVAVFDADTGAYKRHWGAYGKPPVDPPGGEDPDYNPAVAPPQFRNPVHCSNVAKDGLVYVCDRTGDRIQIFKKDGSYIKEVFIARKTLGPGAVSDVDFSRDPQQRFLYVADLMNARFWIVQRDTMQVVGHVGTGGRQPGMFYAVHSIATDSHGNVYTGETFEGQRLQRFLYKGMKTVPAPAAGYGS